MPDLHAVIGWATLAAGAALLIASGLATALDRWHESVRRFTGIVLAVFAFQGATGLALLAMGNGPGEGLHIVYGLGLVAVIPLGATFASDAPPRARSAVLAVTAVTALLLGWRLFATG